MTVPKPEYRDGHGFVAEVIRTATGEKLLIYE